MNKSEKYKDDPLGRFLSSSYEEKAPDGFTLNVMTRIRLETIPVRRTRNPAPLIYGIFIVLLIVVAISIPGNPSDSLLNPVLGVFKNAKSLLPQINFSAFFQFSLPAVIIYAMIGLLILTFFDRAIRGVFRKS